MTTLPACDGKKKGEDGDFSEDAGSVKSKRKKSEDNAKEKAVAKTVTELQEKHGGNLHTDTVSHME